MLNLQLNRIKVLIGQLSNLPTVDKSTIVNAIDEINKKLPPVSSIIATHPAAFTDASNGGLTPIAVTFFDSHYPRADGSLVSDPESPYNGFNLPNITDRRMLLGDNLAGTIGGNNDGHFHSTGIGGSLTAVDPGTLQTSSFSHGHGDNGHAHSYTLANPGAEADNAQPDNGVTHAGATTGTGFASIAASGGVLTVNSHSHNVTGNIGNVSSGNNGDAAESNIPRHLTVEYRVRIK